MFHILLNLQEFITCTYILYSILFQVFFLAYKSKKNVFSPLVTNGYILLKLVFFYCIIYVLILCFTRFGTISALSQSDSDNSDSEDKGQAFYAGGSEHR